MILYALHGLSMGVLVNTSVVRPVRPLGFEFMTRMMMLLSNKYSTNVDYHRCFAGDNAFIAI